ncbi:MAG: hypothetical protein VB835_13825 [Pirellulales bacterium]
MANRYYPAAVVLFWLSTMSWLVLTKVLPALRRGEPPDHHAVFVDRQTDALPVIWDMKWDMRPIGWAASDVSRRPDGRAVIHSRIRFTGVPKANGNQGLIYAALTNLAKTVRIDNCSELASDGGVERIRSIVRHNGKQQPLLRVEGKIVDGHLNLQSWLMDQKQPDTKMIPVRPGSLVANEVSPRGYMPKLRLHQQWTTYHVSPLRPGQGQKVVSAKVERYETMQWQDRITRTLVVIYRDDAGASSRSAHEHLGRLWVRVSDGMVLKQEVIIFGSQLTFHRQPTDKARLRAEQLEKDWSTESLERLESNDARQVDVENRQQRGDEEAR